MFQYELDTRFGTRGSEVQILSPRPILFNNLHFRQSRKQAMRLNERTSASFESTATGDPLTMRLGTPLPALSNYVGACGASGQCLAVARTDCAAQIALA